MVTAMKVVGTLHVDGVTATVTATTAAPSPNTTAEAIAAASGVGCDFVHLDTVFLFGVGPEGVRRGQLGSDDACEVRREALPLVEGGQLGELLIRRSLELTSLLVEQRVTRVTLCGFLGVARPADRDPTRDGRHQHSRRRRPAPEPGSQHTFDDTGDRDDPIVRVDDEVAQSLTVAPYLQYAGRHRLHRDTRTPWAERGPPIARTFRGRAPRSRPLGNAKSGPEGPLT
jgi:hypothetical protein